MVEIPKVVSEEVDYAAPLLYAVAASSPGCVKLLIEAGADVDIGVDDGITPLMLAAALNNRVMVNMFLAEGADLDEQAVEISNFSLPGTRGDALVQVRRSLPSEPVAGASALWLAARAGHIDIVRLLLQAGADTDVEATCKRPGEEVDSDETCTAGQAAALSGYRKVAALLEDPPPAEGGAPTGTAANLRLLLQSQSGRKAE